MDVDGGLGGASPATPDPHRGPCATADMKRWWRLVHCPRQAGRVDSFPPARGSEHEPHQPSAAEMRVGSGNRRREGTTLGTGLVAACGGSAATGVAGPGIDPTRQPTLNWCGDAGVSSLGTGGHRVAPCIAIPTSPRCSGGGVSCLTRGARRCVSWQRR